MSGGTLAIAVVLLVPEEVRAEASLLNTRLSAMLRFDDSHLPHVTLLQQFLPTATRGRAEEALATIAAAFDALTIYVTGVRAQPFGDAYVSYWDIERSEALQALHNRVCVAFAPFACAGNEESFVRDENRPVRTSTTTYVQEFRRKYAADNFEPHVTLGFGPPDLQQRPFSFTANRLAICHLGELNTCRRVLYEHQL